MTRARKLGLTAAAMALAALLAWRHHRAWPEVAERLDLHGTWRIVSREVNGRAIPVAPGETVALDGVAMTFALIPSEDDAESEPGGPFRLDARAVPRRMDIRFGLRPGSTPANRWDGLTRAVYQSDGSTLRLAWYTNDVSNPDPNRRPPRFPSRPGAYTARLVLAR